MLFALRWLSLVRGWREGEGLARKEGWGREEREGGRGGREGMRGERRE